MIYSQTLTLKCQDFLYRFISSATNSSYLTLKGCLHATFRATERYHFLVSVFLECGTALLGDWCQMFQDSMVVSYQGSKCHFDIMTLENETTILSQNNRHQSPSHKEPHPQNNEKPTTLYIFTSMYVHSSNYKHGRIE